MNLDRSQPRPNNGADVPPDFPMVSALSQAQVLIALVVAAHAGVLAVRLCFSLYKA
jgi:photosystem I subunit 12